MKRKPAESRAALASETLMALLRAGEVLGLALDEVCQEHGVTHDQYNVLRILRGAQPDGHPRGAIAERMVSRAPDVTRMIDRLERRGLVRRDWHPENRRLSIAKITGDGLALLVQVDPAVRRLQTQRTASLSKAEMQTLRRLCRMLPE